MLEEALTLPPRALVAMVLSSPLRVVEDDAPSDISSVWLEVRPPSSPRSGLPRAPLVVPASPEVELHILPPFTSATSSSPREVVDMAGSVAITTPLTVDAPARLPPKAKGRARSASTPTTTARKSARLGASARAVGVSPNAVEKALRRAGLATLTQVHPTPHLVICMMMCLHSLHLRTFLLGIWRRLRPTQR